MTKMMRSAMRNAVAGLVALLVASNAQANSVNTNVTLDGGTNHFGALHFDDLDFTDTFTIAVAGSVIASLSLTTIGEGANNIDFVSADLNGLPLTLSGIGVVETGNLLDTSLTGPLTLTVRGRSGATGGTFASYAGTINVAIVPEPSTALLMGLGIGGLGLAARRARA